MTDEDLMTAFQDGDDAAFEQLYARYQRSIYQFVYRRMANGPRAEELTQEVFMGLIRSRGTWRREASFKTYLYRIAFNQCASEARRADFRANEPLEYPDGTPKDVEAGGLAPDAEATRREEAGLVARALGELDVDQREAIMLREYQGLAYEEIAEVLGVAIGTVKSRIFRGKMELKRLLAPVLGADAGGGGGGKVIPMRSPSQ